MPVIKQRKLHRQRIDNGRTGLVEHGHRVGLISRAVDRVVHKAVHRVTVDLDRDVVEAVKGIVRGHIVTIAGHRNGT